MKILITGAGGFVGQALSRQLEKTAGVTTHGLGRRPQSGENYSQIDLTQPFDLDFNPDTVIHTAARVTPWGTKQEFVRQNVLATKHVMDFCAKKNVQSLIYISSTAVFYQEKDQFGITEKTPIGPEFVNLYAKTKHEGECLIKRFRHRHVILRPRAVFGPGDTVLFPRILAAAKAGRLPRLLRPDPPAKGDLIYIDCLRDYIIQAAMNPQISGEFNLTNNTTVELEAFLFKVLDKLDIPRPTRKIKLQTALAAASLTEWLYKYALPGKEPPVTRFGISSFGFSKTFDATKTLQAFGPPSTDVETGINRFVEWQRAHMPA